MDFGNLIEVLEAELEIYKKFAEVENEKTAVIIEDDIEKLDDILNVEQELHMKVQNVERTRVAAIKSLGLEKNTLLDVIELSDGGQKTALAKLFDDLNDCIGEIKELNGFNTKLIKSKLEIITAVNGLYMEADTGQANDSAAEMAVYGKDAKVSRQPDNFERSVVRKKL